MSGIVPDVDLVGRAGMVFLLHRSSISGENASPCIYGQYPRGGKSKNKLAYPHKIGFHGRLHQPGNCTGWMRVKLWTKPRECEENTHPRQMPEIRAATYLSYESLPGLPAWWGSDGCRFRRTAQRSRASIERFESSTGRGKSEVNIGVGENHDEAPSH